MTLAGNPLKKALKTDTTISWKFIDLPGNITSMDVPFCDLTQQVMSFKRLERERERERERKRKYYINQTNDYLHPLFLDHKSR